MNDTDDQDFSAAPAAEPTTTPRKRAAKKAATKKSAAKKAPAKKAATSRTATSIEPSSDAHSLPSPMTDLPPADDSSPTAATPKKRAAKKAAKKAAAPAHETMELPLLIEQESPKPAKKASSRAAKAATPTPEPSPEPSSSEPSPAESAEPSSRKPRYGRVPGGGPTPQDRSPEPDEPVIQTIHETSPTPPNSTTPSSSDSAPSADSQVTRESRSKRRREKRKRRKQQLLEQAKEAGNTPPSPSPTPPPPAPPTQQPTSQSGNSQRFSHVANQSRQNPQGRPHSNHAQAQRTPTHRQKNERVQEPRVIPLHGPKIDTDGMLEIAPKGFGFLRVQSKGFEQARDDIFVAPETIRKNHLRHGQWIHGCYQLGSRGPQLVDVTAVNGLPPEEAAKLPHFDELKAINPSKRISFESSPDRYTTRVLDIMAPVGRGQRGLIVSPPRSGKTTLLLHMAEAIHEKYEDSIHLMVLLVDERPEEVTEFRRALPGIEIYASSNDEQARSHCRIAELAIERAKRLVEAGKDVFVLMDSITRLARAYNNNANHRGRGVGSGGITIGALEVPRRLFAAARNTREAGSLTIMATALIQTNSRADEAIFQEFKGTGNMELVLDRKLAENYIYPAVDIFKSGTRREELLLAGHSLHKINLIRRGLSGHRPVEAMERLLFFLKKFPNNPQMLLEIKG